MECDKVVQHLRDAGIKAEAYHAGFCYCDRVECDKVAQHLRDAGIKAEAYHAGLSDTQRNNVQLRWIREDDCKVSILCIISYTLSSLTLPVV